jgi:hypothetical protein
MSDDHSECWFHLCQLASVEQDPEKLLALVQEINLLLEKKERDRNRDPQSKLRRAPESDGHQDEARQPYRSREHKSADSFLKSSEQSSGKKQDDPEQSSE